jgi:hypothetical protein
MVHDAVRRERVGRLAEGRALADGERHARLVAVAHEVEQRRGTNGSSSTTMTAEPMSTRFHAGA